MERARSEPSGEPVEEQVRALVAAEAGALPERERARLAQRVLRLATGLGPLDPLLADAAVDEVMVNGGGEVYVERDGRVEPADARFADTAELMHAIERILAPLGRRVDEASPLCDARLPDGSRVNVVIPPLAVDGPCLTIRRFRRGGFSLADLVQNSTAAAAARRLSGRRCREPRDHPRERRHRAAARPRRSALSPARSRRASGS